jgi:subtilisin family serine protease
VDNDADASDCNGHGTHVAGTIGGATYGVAKGVDLVAVRVLDCGGSAPWSVIIAGIDFVTADHDAGEPAVANMSLGGGANIAVDLAVKNSIADGVAYAVAAGNANSPACVFSPARVPEAMTSGASTISDAKASFSNWGTCMDWFAPGQAITSAWRTSDSATNTISGTSMASPHTAGVAALYLESNPAATPATVHKSLASTATTRRISGLDRRFYPGTANLLLYTDH